jgi:hypothetical protein
MRRWPIVAIVATFALSSYVPLPAHAVLVIVSYLTVYAGAHASLDSKAEEVRALAISGVRASCAGAAVAALFMRLKCFALTAILAARPRRFAAHRRRHCQQATPQCFLSAAR